MEHEPQIPSLQDLLKVRVGSISLLININASSVIGPSFFLSTKYLSSRGFWLSSLFHLYILKMILPGPSVPCIFPGTTLEFVGSVKLTMN